MRDLAIGGFAASWALALVATAAIGPKILRPILSVVEAIDPSCNIIPEEYLRGMVIDPSAIPIYREETLNAS